MDGWKEKERVTDEEKVPYDITEVGDSIITSLVAQNVLDVSFKRSNQIKKKDKQKQNKRK